ARLSGRDRAAQLWCGECTYSNFSGRLRQSPATGPKPKTVLFGGSPMRALLLAAVLIGIGCKSSVEPTGPLRPEMYGYYYLETVNGESLPYSESDAGGVLYTFHSGQITLLEDGECSNSIHWQYEWEDQLWED